jgi:enamine deaminase RidA (YjgF/YER057c/UK114 family)
MMKNGMKHLDLLYLALFGVFRKGHSMDKKNYLFATLSTVLIACWMGLAAQPAAPPQPRTVKTASPSVSAGELLYVSGQDAKDEQGHVSPDPVAQVRQCLAKVKAIVEAAGLSMEHVVYVQVYLTNYADEGPLNQGWKEFFPKAPPARSTIGVASLGGSPVTMTAVAVQDLARKRTLVPPGYPASSPLSPGVRVGNRLFLSGHLGRNINTGEIPQDPEAQVQLSIDRMRGTLKLAGADLANVVFMIPYFTDRVSLDALKRVCAMNFDTANPPAWTPIHVIGLPSKANVEFTGVAILDLTKRRAVQPRNAASSPISCPCVIAEDTLYCSAQAGSSAEVKDERQSLSIESQTRQTMRSLRDALALAKMNFSNVVAAHVYLDDIQDAGHLDPAYIRYFSGRPPARTVLQPAAATQRAPDSAGHWPALEEISIVAVK